LSRIVAIRHNEALASLTRSTSLRGGEEPTNLTFLAVTQDHFVVSLTRSTSLRGGEEPTNLAFLAMTQHHLGRSDDARGSLAQLRKLVKQLGDALTDDDARFLLEAEDLIEGMNTELPEDVLAR
jgi:hypothetical protein